MIARGSVCYCTKTAAGTYFFIQRDLQMRRRHEYRVHFFRREEHERTYHMAAVANKNTRVTTRHFCFVPLVVGSTLCQTI